MSTKTVCFAGRVILPAFYFLILQIVTEFARALGNHLCHIMFQSEAFQAIGVHSAFGEILLLSESNHASLGATSITIELFQKPDVLVLASVFWLLCQGNRVSGR